MSWLAAGAVLSQDGEKVELERWRQARLHRSIISHTPTRGNVAPLCKRIYFRPRTRKLFSPSAAYTRLSLSLIIWTNSFAIQPGAARARERNFHKIDAQRVCVSCTSPILSRLGLIKTLCVFSLHGRRASAAAERKSTRECFIQRERCGGCVTPLNLIKTTTSASQAIWYCQLTSH